MRALPHEGHWRTSHGLPTGIKYCMNKQRMNEINLAIISLVNIFSGITMKCLVICFFVLKN